ncbi:MAG: phosphoribosylanthranilate isomerase [Saprospiraceae bacterium]|nr:phosphoribosylanthranilate isomerase [Saprospiraceae bacterium]
MRESWNIQEIANLGPDFMGFIFYKSSKRFVGGLEPETLHAIPKTISKVGVFVNEDVEFIAKQVKKYDLDYAQLHGDESPQLAKKLADKSIRVIKVIHIANELPEDRINEFEDTVSFFLLDTSSPNYGGTGMKFDWAVLKDYKSPKQFMLSGGINSSDLDRILSLNHPGLMGIDVNSKFEISPGIKDVEKLKDLRNQI